jgi:hypothetical protein
MANNNDDELEFTNMPPNYLGRCGNVVLEERALLSYCASPHLRKG